MSGHAVVSRRNEDGAAQQSASGALCARANGNGENTSGPSLGRGVDVKDRRPAAQYQLRVAVQVCQRARSSESGREDEGVCMKMATPKKNTRRWKARVAGDTQHGCMAAWRPAARAAQIRCRASRRHGRSTLGGEGRTSRAGSHRDQASELSAARQLRRTQRRATPVTLSHPSGTGRCD